jgi:plastocyanin
MVMTPILTAYLLTATVFAQECDTENGDIDLGVIYQNITSSAQVRAYTNSLGATLNDLDGDGDIDIYSLSGPSRVEEGIYYNGESYVFLNNGSLEFEEVGSDWGLDDLCEDRAVMFGDLNNDHLPDLYVTVNGRNLVYRNYGNGDFRDVTAWSGQADTPGWSHQGFLFDYDRDGYLDIFFTNGPEDGSGFNTLVRNQGDGTFEDVTELSGVKGDPSGKGSCVIDANVDGWPDVFVATGREFGNHLFINQGDGTFDDQALEWGVSDPFQRFGIGPTCGDINNDGLPDIFLVTHDAWWSGNLLYMNQGGYFSEVAQDAGVDEYLDGHGNAMTDVDNDGFLDFVISGIGTQPKILLNRQDETFGDVCYGGGLSQQNGLTWAVVPGDIDGDGFPEIYITNGLGRRPGENNLFKHTGTFATHYLTIDVRGVTHNPSQIGAKIEVVTPETVITRWVGSWSSFDSQGPLPVTIGLGDNTTAESITVTFTNGTTHTITDVSADQVIVIEEPSDFADNDHDGVKDTWDLCPSTPLTMPTDGEGCAPQERAGLALGLAYPPANEVITTTPTFIWETVAASSVLEISVDGTFGPAGTYRYGPTAQSQYAMSDSEWEEILADSDGTKPLIWRVTSIGEDGAVHTTDPRAAFGAQHVDKIMVPEGANLFNPAHVVVSSGTTVTYRNNAVSEGNIQNEIHDIQIMGPLGETLSDKIDLDGGEDYTFEFTQLGQHSMVCHRHAGVAHHTDTASEGAVHGHGHLPNQYHCMSGTVTVK